MSDFFEMCYELVHVKKMHNMGYRNCIDIQVDSEDSTFLLSNGIVSHNSALGGLMPVLGRKDCAYYTLKGKPLNAYSSPSNKFTANKELSGLFQVIKNGVEFKDAPDGDWYEIDLNGKKMVVNINDEIKIDNNWIKVKDLINDSNDSNDSNDVKETKE